MDEVKRPPGKTTISPGVLVTIAKFAALGVEGVSRLAPLPGGVNNIFKRGQSEGIRLNIEDDKKVSADLHVILTHKVNVRDTSKMIQDTVKRAISKMVGMEVGAVNIHIEDIDYPENGE